MFVVTLQARAQPMQAVAAGCLRGVVGGARVGRWSTWPPRRLAVARGSRFHSDPTTPPKPISEGRCCASRRAPGVSFLRATLSSTAAAAADGDPSAVPPGERVCLLDMSEREMQQWVESLGERRYRAQQLWRWLYHVPQRVPFEHMTDIKREFRERLGQCARQHALGAERVHAAADGTQKITFELQRRSGTIESVWIPADGRNTLCISSQLGCAMNCQFCFTAKMGLSAHLTTGEIVDQVLRARELFERPDEDPATRLGNVVFMGMGEPLHNVDNVLRAVDILLHDKGLHLSHNKVTVSTAGLVPEMRRYLRESRAHLAVSLNATTDEVRSWIMPINRKYPIAQLMETLREEYAQGHRRGDKVFIEYVLLHEVNDTLQDAQRLLQLTAHVPCKINLIPFNAHVGTEFRPSPLERVEAFRAHLHRRGATVTVRRQRGDDKMAACGQLGCPGERSTPPRMRVPSAFRHAVHANAPRTGGRVVGA
ncbi:hypothetical protein CDCA_CDCA04G1166 [Cyanidium caldarium]|uniref:Radical SAM core domain-containing protein n=1 Tax=Cyanidium caldarium TaxID=2771 RepID=A0AAV9IST0_CYACA|nr:hypothetical protein CDCA_CDCA04G1166 [Cyanidium caldarium]